MSSIALADFGWSTPDGRVLFSGLTLTFGLECVGLVGRNGVGKSTLLKIIRGQIAPTSGRVSVQGKVSSLQQIVQIGPEDTIADLFGVAPSLALLRMAEAGDASGDELADADWTLEARLAASLERIGLQIGPDVRLSALSGGQRTRAALAAAIFDDPEILLLDEPTNNLDRAGRDAVLALLRDWRGGAVVVSHDRELLEDMDAIVELTSLGASRYSGGWSAYRARKDIELEAAAHELESAERAAATARRRDQEKAERRDRRDSAGARQAKGGGIPRILLGARKNQAEVSGGVQAKSAERRQVELDAAAARARGQVEILQPFVVSLPPSGLASGRTVLRLDDVAAGYDPERPLIDGLSFAMTGPERIAILGPNGSGKSTLLKVIVGDLAPLRGRVMLSVPAATLNQRVDLLDPATTIRDNFLRLNPGATENACRAALATFQFRADAALMNVGTLSGGQMLGAGLACVLGGPKPPQLLVLDEPTNHLDLEAIRAVEAGLAAYDGALLVVSHDQTFLAALGIQQTISLDRMSR
jgi:ATPase subunit of ABC transporter with duplicated ATPase domains